MPVPKAMEGSWEDEIFDPNYVKTRGILLKDNEIFDQTKGHRAIGVVYHPNIERGNYVSTDLSDRYDILIYVNTVSALHLIREVGSISDPPETFPFGF